jgi:PLP dependent protein
MHITLNNLKLINNEIKEIVNKKQLKITPDIIAVSKTFPLEKILPLIESGHIHFGENKVQEAETKWLSFKNKNHSIKLHMIGKLQSNKAKKAVQIFDYIHSLDNIKLAEKISFFEKKQNKKTKLFIQVNLANEQQKSGILSSELDSFYMYCIKDLSLDVIGLMCLPPMNTNTEMYFKKLKEISIKLKVEHLSMGMSSDYSKAVACGSTFLRLGTVVFGNRST